MVARRGAGSARVSRLEGARLRPVNSSSSQGSRTGEPFRNLRITINRHSDVPRYIQLQGELEYFIVTGAVPPGSRLPSIRSIARDTGLSTMTVMKAYEGLQHKGLVHIRRSDGVFVAAGDDGDDGELQREMTDFVRRALARGTSPEALARSLAQTVAKVTNAEQPARVVLIGPSAGGLFERAARLQSALADSPAEVVPVEIERLAADRDVVLEQIGQARIHATLLFDVAAVRAILEPVGVAVEPLLARVRDDVRAALAKLPSDARLAIAASSREFLSGMVVAIEEFRSLSNEPICASTEDMAAVRRAVQSADAVVYGSLAKDKIVKVLPAGVPAIELLYDVDPQSVERLQMSIRNQHKRDAVTRSARRRANA